MPDVLPLPPAKITWVDLNGAPLVGGFVYHFVPDSDTPKDTWQDRAGTTLNSNPIVLDERGQAAVWGEGAYRQRVLDSLGNEIYDAETEIACCDGGGDDASSYYEVSVYYVGEVDADAEVLVWNFAQDVNLSDDFAGATPRIATPPGSDIEWDIVRLDADDAEDTIGTISISSAGVITFATTETPEFVSGGAMKIVGGADSDGAAGFSCTFLGFPVAT